MSTKECRLEVDEPHALDNEEILELREDWTVLKSKSPKTRRVHANTIKVNERKAVGATWNEQNF